MKKLISRRNFLKVCALAGSAAALSACGGGKSNGSNNSAAAAVDVSGAVEFPLSEKVNLYRYDQLPCGQRTRAEQTAPSSSVWKSRPMCTSTGPPSSPTSGAIRSP